MDADIFEAGMSQAPRQGFGGCAFYFDASVARMFSLWDVGASLSRPRCVRFSPRGSDKSRHSSKAQATIEATFSVVISCCVVHTLFLLVV